MKNRNHKSRDKFLLPFISFLMISFMIFAPTANILFSLPNEVKAADPAFESIADEVTYGVAYAICWVLWELGLSSATASAALVVPVADPFAGAGSVTVTQSCAANWGEKIKNAIVEAITYAGIQALHMVLQEITNQILAYINSDEFGKKSFVLDFNKLTENAAQVAGAKFLNSLTGINLCSFTPAINLQISLLPVPEFKKKAECTLDDIVDNIEDFHNDFRKGGWVAWKESLKPNNNAFGIWLMTQNEKLSKEYETALNEEKGTSNGFKSKKKCLDPQGVDPDGVNCKISAYVTPSGTVETAVNFAALGPIRQTEGILTAAYSKLGPFGIYATAISNALLNKLLNEGLEGLLGIITPDDLAQPNPYKDIIDQTASTAGDYSTAQGNQAQANLIIQTLQNLDTYISNTAQPTYFDVTSVLSNIQTQQEQIINTFWAQGKWGDATAIIVSGPTATTTGSTTTTETTYSVAHLKVGTAKIIKTETTYSSGSSTITYSVIEFTAQIANTFTQYTDKLNALTYTQSQIGSAIGPAQDAYDAITAYINTWDGSQGNEGKKIAMDNAIANAIPYIQGVIPSTSTTLSQLSKEVLAILNTTQNDINSINANQTLQTYQDYLTEVQNIYNSL